MKKYLPLILFFVGLVVLGGSYFFLKNFSSGSEEVDEESNVPEIPLADRPFASLAPSTDGHWLELNIKNLKISAETLDYELVYQVPDGRSQGVPGTVKLSGEDIERDLLLGSESSGKYRYDEGVERGTLTLRFRDENGKLIGKLKTDFHLQTATRDLVSVDTKFKYVLDKDPGKEFFVVMNTFGLPNKAPGDVLSGPYGVFKATANVKTAKGILPVTSKVFPGTVELGGSIHRASKTAWDKLEGGKSSDVGTFVGLK